jgi:hypothetical protein
MAGTIIRAVPKTKYDFSAITTTNTTSPAIFIAKGIDVGQYAYAEMNARIHSLSVVGASSTPSVALSVRAEAPSPDDPSVEFYTATFNTITFNLTPSSTAPLLSVVGLTGAPLGRFLRIQLTGSQGGTLATTFWVILSVDILARS